MTASNAAVVASARGNAGALSLSAAFRKNTFDAGRHVSELAVRVGFATKDLYRWATDPDNASQEHRDPPARAIVPITLATGRFDILDFLEDQVGRVACVRPAPALLPRDLLSRVAALTAEFADVQAACAPVLDGVTAGEARALAQQISELEAQAEALRLAVAGAIVRRPLAKVDAR